MISQGQHWELWLLEVPGPCLEGERAEPIQGLQWLFRQSWDWHSGPEADLLSAGELPLLLSSLVQDPSEALNQMRKSHGRSSCPHYTISAP